MRWTRAEVEALKANYRSKGPSWEGWKRVLPGRTKRSICSKATLLGICYDKRAGNVRMEQISVRVCGDCRFFRDGRCHERHAVGMFRGAPEVKAHYDAGLCDHKAGRLVEVMCDDDGERQELEIIRGAGHLGDGGD